MGEENSKNDILPNKSSEWLEKSRINGELQVMYRQQNMVTTIKVIRLE
jgi:hypothetical protein